MFTSTDRAKPEITANAVIWKGTKSQGVMHRLLVKTRVYLAIRLLLPKQHPAIILVTTLVRQTNTHENLLVYLPFCPQNMQINDMQCNKHSYVCIQITVSSKPRCLTYKFIGWYYYLMSNEHNSEWEQSPILIPNMRVYIWSHTCKTIGGFSLVYTNVAKIRIWLTHSME